MADPSFGEAKTAFLRTFQDTARHQHRYEVWRDFVTMAACSLHNAWQQHETIEREYLEIIKRYDKPDQGRFPQLMAQTVAMLEDSPRDVLGPLFLELEIASKDKAQFFTPPDLSGAMARMIFTDQVRLLETEPFITAHEPACGAGGMVLALVKVLIEAGHDPAKRLWVQCIDIDRTAALMCYIQLSLWNVPGEIIAGNTLSLDLREAWRTPAHQIGGWQQRLTSRPIRELPESPAPWREPPEQLSLF